MSPIFIHYYDILLLSIYDIVCPFAVKVLNKKYSGIWLEKPSCLWQCLSGARLWVPLLRGTEVGTVLLCDRLTYQLDFVIIREGFEHHHQRHIRNLLRSGYFFVTGEIICLWHKYLLGCNFQSFMFVACCMRRGFTTFFKNETGSTVIEMGSNRSCTARMFKAWFEVAYLWVSSSHECGEYSCIEKGRARALLRRAQKLLHSGSCGWYMVAPSTVLASRCIKQWTLLISDPGARIS